MKSVTIAQKSVSSLGRGLFARNQRSSTNSPPGMLSPSVSKR